MAVSIPQTAGLSDPAPRRAALAASQPWPRLPCLLGALLASCGLWAGLLALGRLLIAG